MVWDLQINDQLDGHLAIAQFCSPVLPLLASITVLKL